MQKRISKLLLSLCIMCVSFVTFSMAASAAYVTYIVGSGSDGMGTVGISTDYGTTITKGDVNQLTVPSGTTVMLFAYPNSGYSFDKFGGFIGSTSASIATAPYGDDGTYVGIFTMGSDNFIGYASFKAAATYTITATAETGGTVTGGGTVAEDGSTTLTATADKGYVFAGWYSGSTKVSDSSSYTVSNVKANATYTAKFAQAVAKIGNTYYASLANAIAAVPTTGAQTTVTLLSNVDLGSSYLNIEETKNIDLDLGGFTLSGSNAYYVIRNHGTIVVRNGIVNAASAMGIVGYYSHTTTLADVTLNHSGQSVSAGSLGGDLIINSGTVINNTSSGMPLGAQYYNETKASITVNGGVITGGGINLFADPTNITVTLNGGTFDTNVVTDQTHDVTLGTLSDYSAEGKIVTYDGTYYTVTDSVPANAVAKVGNMYYTSLQAAINAVPTDGTQTTITLLSDINESDVVANGNIVIDLDGHKWTAQGTSAIQVASGAVTLKNGTIEGGTAGTVMTQSGSTTTLDNVTVSGSSAIVAQGTVTIEGNSTVTGSTAALNSYGSIIVNSGVLSGALTTNGGTITVNDGTFTADPTAYVASGTPVARANDGKYLVNAYRVETAATEGGSVEQGDAVKTGDSITLVAKADDGYRFLGWYDGENKVSSDASFTLTNVTDGKTYTAKFIETEIVAPEAFQTITDSGYYGEYQTPANGIIAFNTYFNNFNADKIEKFGLFIFVTGGKQVDVQATTADELKTAEGKFFATVSNIPVEYFESAVYAKPYVVIDGTVYYGDVVSCTVNSEKWLGTNN